MNLVRSIAAEFRKLLTTRLWWVLALLLFAYVGFTAAGIAGAIAFTGEFSANGEMPPGLELHPLVYSLATAIGYVFPVLLGALSSTSEFRHQTLTPSFLATPKRGYVLVAKAITLAVFGAVFGVIALVATIGLGAPMLALGGVENGLGDTETWLMAARVVLAMALWSAIGVAIGALIPSQVAAIVVVIVFTQFVEPILRFGSALWEPAAEIGRYLPGAASDALVGASIYTSLSGGTAEPLLWWQGGLVLAGIAVVALLLARVTSWRRDVT